MLWSQIRVFFNGFSTGKHRAHVCLSTFSKYDVYLNNKILSLGIHAGYEGGKIAEKLHDPH